jgi:hypothetical protein
MREPKDFDKGVTARGENQNFFPRLVCHLQAKGAVPSTWWMKRCPWTKRRR